MSDIGPEHSGSDLSAAVERDFASILDLNLQIARIVAQRKEVLTRIRERIREEGLPDQAKFIAKVLMSSDIKDKDPETISKNIDYLKGLDERLKSCNGQPIAWLNVENETVAYRDPGPNLTEKGYYLNIGLLPYDSSLQVSSLSCKIPVEKAVRVRFHNNLDRELSWDMEIGSFLHRFMGQPEWVDRPEIYVSGDGPISVSGLKAIALPSPAIGSEAVESLFDKYKLEEQPQVTEALKKLSESLF